MSSTPRSPAGNPLRRRKTQPASLASYKQTAFESFAETTSAAIFITQGRNVLYANSAASRSTGYTREELLGMELWQIAHPNYQSALKQLGKTHAWVEHIPSRYEIKIVTKAGEENWLDVTIGDVEYQGEPALAVTAFDITERDRAERALRKAQAELEARVQERTAELAAVNERLQSVLDTIAEAYVAFDSDWRFLTFNHVAETEIFGRPVGELVGKVIWDEYPQTVGQEVDVQYHRAVETGQPIHFEAPSRIVPGRWFEVHAYPRGRQLEAYFRDITERVQAQAEIASLAKFPSENPNPVLRMNMAGEVLYANQAGRTLLEAWARTTGDVTLSYWHSLAAQAAASQANQTIDTAFDGRTYAFFVVPIVDAGYINFYGLDTSQRTQAEEALHESEERYRLLFDNSLDGILLTTPDGGIQAANAAACRMFGRTEEEICRVGRTGVVDVSDPRVAAALQERARTGKFHSEMFLLRADGTRFQGEVSSMMFTGKDGRLRTSLIVRDITERKRAEEALRESEVRFRIALQNSPITVATLDRDLRYTWVYNTRHGFDPSQVLGKRPDELIAPEEARELMVLLQRALETGSTEHNEVSGHTRGERWAYDVTAEPLRNATGRVIGLTIANIDIAARRRMEEALRQAHDELEIRIQERTQELAQINDELRLQMAAVRAAANGIVITDRQGGIQWCNPAFTDMTGYAAEEVLGKNLRLLNSGQQSADFYRQLWVTILAGDAWRGELTNRRKDGRLYVEEQTIAPVLNGQREITHFIAIKQDITPRKQAAERLARYNQDLLAVSKAERDQRQLAETLTAASLALTQSLNLETVLETLLDCVAQLVPYDSANVMLLESESRLAVRVTRGYERWTNAELVRAITFDAQTSPLFNALLTTRRSCLVPDTRLEPGWQTPPGVEHVRNWLGVPLMAGGNVIGVYSLDKAEPRFFTAEHVHMAEILVGQAAVAIQNAWLFEQVRAGRERLQSLSHRLVEVQEAERHYVARELHDEAGQALTSLLFGLGQLEQQLNDPGQANQVIELKHMTNGVLDSLHRLAMDLRPASLDHLGLVPALAQYVKALGDRYGLIAQFKTMGFEGERLSSDMETALYRIVQEALTNVMRHARATRADVLLERRGEHVVVVIEDNGRGFNADIAHFAQQGHLGLIGMQERAEMLGGSLVIESTAGTGTTIVVEVPDDYSHLDR